MLDPLAVVQSPELFSQIRETVSRKAHNLEIVGSTPTSATCGVDHNKTTVGLCVLTNLSHDSFNGTKKRSMQVGLMALIPEFAKKGSLQALPVNEKG